LRQFSQAHSTRHIKLGHVATSALFVGGTGNAFFDGENSKAPPPSKRITHVCLLEAEIVKSWDSPNGPLAKRPPKDMPNAIVAHCGFELKQSLSALQPRSSHSMTV